MSRLVRVIGGGPFGVSFGPNDRFLDPTVTPGSGSGTEQDPYGRPQDAIADMAPGSKVWWKGSPADKYGAGHVDPVSGLIFNIRGAGIANGTAQAPIEMRAYPGHSPVIEGPSSGGNPTSDFDAVIWRDYWRVSGLVFRYSRVVISYNSNPGTSQHPRGVHFFDNEVVRTRLTSNNNGMVMVGGQSTQGGQIADPSLLASDIHIYRNLIHDPWCEPQGGSFGEWYDDTETIHHGAISIFNSNGGIEVYENEIFNVPAFWFNKWRGWGVTYRENFCHHARVIATAYETMIDEWHDNIFALLTQAGAQIPMPDVTGTGAPAVTPKRTFRGNIFDAAAWSEGAGGGQSGPGWNLIADWDAVTEACVFRRNVTFGSEVHSIDSGDTGQFAGHSVDCNLHIGGSGLVISRGPGASPARDLAAHRAAFVHDDNSVHLVETDRAAVFDGAYNLIGAAAAQRPVCV